MDFFSNVRVFVGVVQSGNFSTAARMTNTTPSAVTRQVAALEDRLGVRLLNRTTRSMELTEAGQIYFQRALSVVRDYDDMNREMADLEAVPRGLLRVSASFSLGATRLAAILPAFLGVYPEVRVELALSDRIVDLVEDKVDIALRISRQLPDSNLIARRLFRYERVICASPRYLADFPPPARPQDLSAHECLTFLAGGSIDFGKPGGRHWRLRKEDKEDVVPVSGRLDSNSLNALIGAALNGFGLFLAPRWLVQDHLSRGELEVVLSDYEVDPNDQETWVYAVYASNRFLSPKVRVFVDYLADKLATP